VQKTTERDSASSIAILQEIFNDPREFSVLKTILAYIYANLNFLSQYITGFEKTTNLLSETTKEISDT
jgi:hypothetical protein